MHGFTSRLFAAGVFLLSLTSPCLAGAGAPAGDAKNLVTTVVIDAPVRDVWQSFATAEGFSDWAVPLAEVDLRVGGTIKTNYDAAAGVDGPGGIVHHILSYDPGKMISSRFDAPANAPQAKPAEKTWGVTYLEPIGPGRTRVVHHMLGWGDDPDSQKAHDFFKAGNEYTFNKLKEKFPPKNNEAQQARALELVKLLGTDHWICEVKNSERVVTFRSASTGAVGPDGKSIMSQGSLGNGTSITPHSMFMAWQDRELGLQFMNVNQSSSTAKGSILLEDDDTLVLDWTETTVDGKANPYIVNMKFTNPEAYTFKLFSPPDEKGERKLAVTADFRRVKELPEWAGK